MARHLMREAIRGHQGEEHLMREAVRAARASMDVNGTAPLDFT
jgi:hypothetical protein